MKNIVSKLKIPKLRGWKLAGVLAGGLTLTSLGVLAKNYELVETERRACEGAIRRADKYLKEHPDFSRNYDTITNETVYVDIGNNWFLDERILMDRKTGELTTETLKGNKSPYRQLRKMVEFIKDKS